MFGSIGGAELVVILVLALLLFGPRKLPQIGRTLGRAMGEFRGAAHEFKSSLEREVEMEQVQDARTSLTSAGREISDAVRGVARGSIDGPGSPSGVAATGADCEDRGADAPATPTDGEPQRES